jgi:ribonucleotide reductase class II
MTKNNPIEENDYSHYIHASRYARWVEEENRRETWPETVKRYCDFFKGRYPNEFPYEEVYNGILNLDVVPSMRALMTAGKALDKDEIAGYNCSFVAVDNPRAFDEILYILMCGTGVGFSVERQFITSLPTVAEEFHDTDTKIVVRDSRLGWASSFRELITLLYSGRVPKWDVSQLRPAGARLKTFGGRSSGPKPLEDLFEFTSRTFKGAAGRKLTSLECHDLVCKVADIVVVGGVRRSALISLSNLTDERMRNAKNGQWWEANVQRALANNSVAYTEKPDIGIFMQEWHSLYESKSGERGIFNRVAATKKSKANGRRDTEGYQYGTNPCVTGDTPILTAEGYVPIEDVVGQVIDIWNGLEWSTVSPFSTGVNPIYEVVLSDGTSLKCTPYHKWILADGSRVMTEELHKGERLGKFDMPVVYSGKSFPIDAYSQGFYSGDGNTGYKFSWLYGTKYYNCKDRLVGTIKDYDDNNERGMWVHGPMYAKGFVPLEANLQYRLDWLAGLIDSDGTVTRDANGNGIQICSTNKEFLLDTRLMLTTMGVRAKVCSGDNEGFRSMPDGKGGSCDYFCKETHRLLIGNTDTYNLVKLGLKTNRAKLHDNPPQRDARRFVTVEAVTYLGEAKTFCFTDPKNNSGTFNGIVTGNCGEIILRSMGLCNLSEVIVRSTDTFEDLKRKIRLATIIGTFQSTLTNFRYVRSGWKKNAEEERLLGVSLTGIMDHSVLSGKGYGRLGFNDPEQYLKGDLQRLKELSVEVNKEWAERLGIQPSVAITTVKPSGTVSQLVDSSSGIHPRYSQYYVRTVRADSKDPLAAFLIEQGVPWEWDVTKPNSVYVFSFPMKSPEGAVLRNDMSAIEQLEHYLVFAKYYCEHNVSCTVYVKENEWLAVGAWVYEHFDELGGISFLPHSDHVYKQAPYQEIEEETYNKLKAEFPKIEWDKFVEIEDTTDNVKELSCMAGGSCEI